MRRLDQAIYTVVHVVMHLIVLGANAYLWYVMISNWPR